MRFYPKMCKNAELFRETETEIERQRKGEKGRERES